MMSHMLPITDINSLRIDPLLPPKAHNSHEAFLYNDHRDMMSSESPACRDFFSLATPYNEEDKVIPYYGMMFSLDAFDTPIEITTLELDLRDDTPIDDKSIVVYMYPGSFETVVSNQSAWTVVANTTAQLLTDIQTGQITSHIIPATSFRTFQVEAESRVSLYITMNGPYLDNTVYALDKTGEVAVTGDKFDVNTGAGFSAPNFPSRGVDKTTAPKFAGSVHYRVLGSCESESSGTATVTTTVIYYYMANRELSDDIFSAVAAGIENILKDVMENDEVFKKYAATAGLKFDDGSVAATAAASRYEESCPMEGWSTCPIIIGTANMTHIASLSDDELLYNLYSLTGQINKAIRQHSISPDTEVIYIGHKDVAADFSMTVRNIPRGQTMTAIQSEFVSQVMLSYLNSTLSSDSKALSVVIGAQLAVKSARQLRGDLHLTRQRRMDVNLGDVQVTGRIYGLQRSFLKDDQFLRELNTALVDEHQNLLMQLRQQLMLPSEINRDDSYHYFDNVTSFDVQVQLFDPPGHDQDDAPIPDTPSADTPADTAQNGGDSDGKSTMIGIGVGVTVGLILVILAGIAAYHFFFCKENESKAGKLSDTDDGDEGSFADDEESFHYGPPALRATPGRSKSFDNSGHSSSSRNAPVRSKSAEGAINYDEANFRRKQEEAPRLPRRAAEHRNSFSGSSHSASQSRQLPTRSKSTEGAILYESPSSRRSESLSTPKRSESGQSLDRSDHSLPARQTLLRSKSCEGAIVYDATLSRRPKQQEPPHPPHMSVERRRSLDGSEHSMRSARSTPMRSKSSQGALHYAESPFTPQRSMERSGLSRSARGPPSRSSSNGSLYGGIVMQGSSSSLDDSMRSCRSARAPPLTRSMDRNSSWDRGNQSSRPSQTNRASLAGFLEHHESRMAEQERMYGARSVQLPSRSKSIRSARPTREFEDVSRRPPPSRSRSDTFEDRQRSASREGRSSRDLAPERCGPRRSKSDHNMSLDDRGSVSLRSRVSGDDRPRSPPPQHQRGTDPAPRGHDSAPRLPASRSGSYRHQLDAEPPMRSSGGSSSRSLSGLLDRAPTQPSSRRGGERDTRSLQECRSPSSSSLSKQSPTKSPSKSPRSQTVHR